FGHRVDEVEFHPSWHRLMEVAVGNGLHALPWYGHSPKKERIDGGNRASTAPKQAPPPPFMVVKQRVPSPRARRDDAGPARWRARHASPRRRLRVPRLDGQVRLQVEGLQVDHLDRGERRR